MRHVSFSELQTCQLFERQRDESFNSITDLNGSGESSIRDAMCFVNSITGLNGSGKSNVLNATCFVLGITNKPIIQASMGPGLLFLDGVGKSNIDVMAKRQGLRRRWILAPEDEYGMAEEVGAHLRLVRCFVLGITNM